MNNTPIDYLLPATPRPEAAPAPTRPRDDAPGFDSLFQQAREPSPPPAQSAAPPPAQPPAAPPQQAKAAADRSAEPTNNPASPAESCPSNDTAACADDERDAKDHDADEATEANAAVAAIATTNNKPVADDSVKLVDAGFTVAIARKQIVGAREAAKEGVPAKPRSAAASPSAQTEIAPAAADEGPIDPDAQPAEAAANAVAIHAVEEVVAAATTDQAPAQPKPAANVAAATEAIATEAIATEAIATDEHQSEPRVKPKSNKNANANSQPVRTRENGEEQPHARASATKKLVEVAATASVENRVADSSSAAAVPESPANKQDDKQIETKTATAKEIDPAPNRPRSAVSRATTLDPAVPVAANVDQSQPAAVTLPGAPDADLKPKEIKPAAKEGPLSPFARLERSGPLNSKASRTSGDREAGPVVDPARFVSRVARAVHTAHERGTPLQLRLSPPELGTMRLELAVHDGALSATIETDNANARQVLLDNLPALRDRLAEQNVRIERFDVDVRRDGTGDGSGGRANSGPQERGQNRHGEPAPHRTIAGRGAANQTTSDTPSPISRTITNTSINLVI